MYQRVGAMGLISILKYIFKRAVEGLTLSNTGEIFTLLKTKHYSNWKFKLNYFNNIKVSKI